MTRPYNTLARRIEALKAGGEATTAKGHRGKRGKGHHGKRVARGKGGRMPRDKIVPANRVPVAVVPLAAGPFQRADTYARALILSGIEPRLAITRAAQAYGVNARLLFGAVSQPRIVGQTVDMIVVDKV